MGLTWNYTHLPLVSMRTKIIKSSKKAAYGRNSSVLCTRRVIAIILLFFYLVTLFHPSLQGKTTDSMREDDFISFTDPLNQSINPIVAFSNSYDVSPGQCTYIKLYSNSLSDHAFRVLSLPSHGIIIDNVTGHYIDTTPYDLAGSIVSYAPEPEYFGGDRFNVTVVENTSVGKNATIFLTSVQTGTNDNEVSSFIPAITSSHWLESYDESCDPTVTKDDYRSFSVAMYEYLQPSFLAELDKGEVYNGGRIAWFEAFMHELTGEKDHFDMALIFLEKHHAYFTNVSHAPSFMYGFDSLRAIQLLQNSPNMTEQNWSFIETYVDDLDDCVVAEGRYDFEYGPHNRPLIMAMSRQIIDNIIPEDDEHEERQTYLDTVWNDWWPYRDTAENSDNYNTLSLFAIDQWIQARGDDHLYQDGGMRSLVNRHLQYFSPFGLYPHHGDSVGLNYQKGLMVSLLERWSTVYQDGSYKWVAHRLFNWTMEHTEDMAPAGYDQLFARDIIDAYLSADDTIAETPPEWTSHQTMRHGITYRDDWFETGYCVELNDRIIPDKLMFRGDELFTLVEVGDHRMSHGHCDSGSINFMTYKESLVMGDTGYLTKEPTFHNMFQVIPDGFDGRWDRKEYTEISETTVPLFDHSPLGSIGMIEIMNYSIQPTVLHRDILCLNDKFLWVKDRVLAQEIITGAFGPAWQTLAIYGEQGSNYANTAYPTIPNMHIWPIEDKSGFSYPAYIMQYQNQPMDLLVFFPNLEGELTIDPVTIDRNSTIVDEQLQTGVKYRIWNKKQMTLGPGEDEQFHSILMPHLPNPMISEFTGSFNLTINTENQSVLLFEENATTFYLGMNERGTEVVGSNFVTDAQTFIVEEKNDQLINYWLVNATYLTYDDIQFYFSSSRQSVYGECGCGDGVCGPGESSSTCPSDCPVTSPPDTGSPGAGTSGGYSPPTSRGGESGASEQNNQTDDKQKVIAYAGGPYHGSVNDIIIFDASESVPTDRIVSYQWKISDGTSKSGKKTTHQFSKPGNYSVKLMVTTLDNQTDVISTYVVIIQHLQKENISRNAMDIKDDNIQGRLIDRTNAGVFDVFLNIKTGITTKVAYTKDGTYLLDINNDQNWDYAYNMATHELFPYGEKVQPSTSFELNPMLLTIMGVCVLVIATVEIIVYMKKIRYH